MPLFSLSLLYDTCSWKQKVQNLLIFIPVCFMGAGRLDLVGGFIVGRFILFSLFSASLKQTHDVITESPAS